MLKDLPVEKPKVLPGTFGPEQVLQYVSAGRIVHMISVVTVWYPGVTWRRGRGVGRGDGEV